MPRIQSREFKAWNERMILKYDPDAFHHHPNPFIRFVERKRVKAIFHLMKSVPGDRILEVGCGAGNVIEQSRNGKVFGVDLSETILLKARERLKETVHLFQGDALNLPCKDQVFTHVICSEVLEHLLDPSRALTEINRVLFQEGVAIVSVPNEPWINWLKSILIHLKIFHWFRSGDYPAMPERMDDEWHLHSFQIDEWVDLFMKSFKVAHLKRIPFFWFPIRYVVRLKK
jgi:ubiquinone/menaquinone biosynthesis C-methylase UbiE